MHKKLEVILILYS